MSAQQPISNEIILTAYFSGTDQDIKEDDDCLATLLYNNTQPSSAAPLGFSGTYKTEGIRGLIFGHGLKKQCRQTRDKVKQLVNDGKKVKLNCYGHSRGAIAALLLAKMLHSVAANSLEINLVFLDPAPGNFLTTGKLDIFSKTLAKQAIDLSKCSNLNRVLSLYTNELRQGIQAVESWLITPLLPKYPANCLLEEDVIPGNHSDAQFILYYGPYRESTSDAKSESALDSKSEPELNQAMAFMNPQSLIAFSRITEFLLECGTEFTFLATIDFHTRKITKKQNTTNAEVEYDFVSEYSFEPNQEAKAQNSKVLAKIYAAANIRLTTPSVRECHSQREATINTVLGKPYLNLHHKKLCLGYTDPKRATDIALAVVPPHGYYFHKQPARKLLFDPVAWCWALSCAGFLLLATMLVISYTLPAFALANFLIWVGLDTMLLAGIAAIGIRDSQQQWRATIVSLQPTTLAKHPAPRFTLKQPALAYSRIVAPPETHSTNTLTTVAQRTKIQI